MAQLEWFEDPKVFRAKRKQLGLTQAQLAKVSKIDRAIIANIEAGRRTLTGQIAESLWNALGEVSHERRAEIAAAETDVERWLQGIERGRSEYPDFDKVVSSPHMIAAFGDSVIPPKDPKALKLWKKAQVKTRLKNRAQIAHEYGSYEKFQQMVADQKQLVAQERQIAALQTEVAAQAEQIAALRDLLDLKTKEVLLRDEIQSEEKPEKAPGQIEQ
jgi:transcriptional regulator with XRE-family HTH domain